MSELAKSKRKATARMEPASVVRRLVEQGVIKKNSRAFCYGCGRGADVGWLRRAGVAAEGYDPHPPFGYTELPNTHFDHVLLVYLMTRLKTDENRRAVIAKAHGYVRPGGYLVLATRNGARFAAEGGRAGNEGAVERFRELLSGCEVEAISCPELDPEDPALCVLVRKPGAYQPRRPVHWVAETGSAAALCAKLQREPRVALDVETTLDPSDRRICTVQLGTEEANWVVDALALDSLEPLKALMEDSLVAKIIHNADFEVEMFGRYGIRVNNIFDTLPASRKKHRKNKVQGGHKLGEVCERELGIYLDKDMQTSDWTQRPLTEAQLAYAAVDAEVLVDLYAVFNPPPPPANLDLFGG